MQHAALVVEKVSSRVFICGKTEGTYPISTQPVEIPHVEIGGSTYMLADSIGSTGTLFKVKGDAGTPQYQVSLSEGEVTITGADITDHGPYTVNFSSVEVDVITIEGTLYVLGETSDPVDSIYRALSTDSKVNNFVSGKIETREGTSTGGVVGIAIKGDGDGDVKTMYTFDEGAQPHAEITSISGEKVRWLDTKPLTEVPNHTLKYGLEAFVWTVKGEGDKITDPFFQQLNASLLALGFHEGDDIALGTNLAILAPTEGVSPLNKVDANDYMHGKTNKAKREQDVDTQRAYAKVELAAWNKQHPGPGGRRYG